ncbi:hypothetical protein UFOVP237_67 [uncultured Caudovirales phage]|uniref:Uncharacterized protein n=1 Tax=uncultured Caudovirales phage TaxID=2100421 RepID=A0A6J7WTD4_9CAUD|nr:hypothetical protein UFOVP237_67 [uncultured Caudovirales phage]
MADTPDYFKDAMASNDQMIGALSQANQNYKPQGIFANVDPMMLNLAKGFLAPTKTGGFGESISNAAGEVAGPLAQMKQAQMTNLEKIAALKNAQARLAMEQPYYQARADLYSNKADAVGNPVLKSIDEIHLHKSRNDYLTELTKATTEEDKNYWQSLIDSVDSELASRRGVSPKTAPVVPPHVDDNRTTWQTYAPGFLGGLPDPNATPAPAPAPAPQAKAQAAPKAAQQPDENNQPSETPIGATKQVKIGKDNMTATYARDGKWYVVKDGKYHPVE